MPLPVPLLLATALAGAPPVRLPPLLPIATVRADRGGDRIPDRLGDTVRIAGRVTMPTGALGSDWLEVFVQDATGGIDLYDRTARLTLEGGDSVEVTGVVSQYNGLTQLTGLRIQLVRAPQRLPAPLAIRFTRASAERYEGMFVRLQGRVLLRERRGAGEVLRLSTGPGPRDEIDVYVRRARRPPIPLDAYEPGQMVEVLGVVGQYDTGAGRDGEYQIYPRVADDISVLTPSPTTYRRFALGALAALCLVLAWVVALRVQVRRRTGQLRASEARFRAIYEGALDGILVLSPTGTVVDANPAATRILGRPLEALAGTPAAPLLHDAQGGDDASPAGEGEREATILRPDGSSVHVAVTRALVRFEREPRVLTLLHDITLRKQAEARLREALDEAERANRAKGDFLSRMSHELRTPLNAILGFAQLLALGERPAEDRESADQILRGGRHLLDLINEVLDISRVESGRLALSPEPVDLSLALSDCLRLVRPSADAREITLHGDECAGEVYVLADRRRLTQVILNLLTNAIKYDRYGGHVTLRCLPPQAGRVRVEVQDTGPGITPEDVARLFVPFERLGAERRGVEGEGIGLALSHGLVRAMGGRMGVDSTPGDGSTFWVDLPLHTAPVPPDAPRSDGTPLVASPNGRLPLRVLYVEDNAANHRLVERVLTARPRMHLATAVTGAEGLAMARAEPPDLLLLDIHLPDMEGGEVYDRLRAESGTARVPVVVISAETDGVGRDALLARGVRAYLRKPLDVSEFLRVVDAVAREREGA